VVKRKDVEGSRGDEGRFAEGSGQEVTDALESGRVDDTLVLFSLWSVSGQVSQEMSRSKIAFSARVTASEALFLKLTNRCRYAIRWNHHASRP
jgi:hypothetical protein